MVDAARAMRAAYDAELATADPVEPPLRIAACEVTAKLFLADALPDWARRSAVPAGLSVYDDLFSLPPVDYDLLVSPMDAPPPGAEAVEIGRIRWGLFAAPDYLAGHPVPPDTARLHGHDVIRACGTLERFAAFGWLVSLGGRAALLSSSPMAQRDACARGVGIALLPVDLVDEDVGLRPIAVAPPPDSPVWLVADQRQASHPRIADFLRWARRRFARDRAGVEQRTLIPAVSG
jgi:DNA-binding transcriptional LysR family regulator